MTVVSFIIPCFNQGEYVMDAIKSVQTQTYKNWEIILINDGSTDDYTNELLNKLVIPGVKVISTTNNGLSAARNTGISQSEGEYILPLDADDKIAPTYIEKAINAFMQKPDLKLVYCRGRYFGFKNEAIPFSEKEIKFKDLLQYNFIFNSALYKKKDIIDCGGYSEEMRGGWEDWDLWIRLLQHNMKVYQIPEELFYYRKKKKSMIEEVRNNSLLQSKLAIQLFKNNQDLYFKEFGDPITILREWNYLKIWQKEEFSLQQQVYQTLSYRLGHFLLQPFKFFKRIFTN
jgi:glycosyltransferase involved in cell wall biosynthesis